jgi:hypothetical protein
LSCLSDHVALSTTSLGKQVGVLLVGLLICAFGGLPGPAAAGSVGDPPQAPRTIRLGCIFDATPGVNTEDARMAMEMLIRNLWEEQGHQLRIQLDFIMDLGQVPRKIASEHYDLAILPALDYLQLRNKVPLHPKLVLSTVDAPTEALVLVTQRNQTFETLAKKDSRILLIDMGRGGEGAKMWLDTVLQEAHLESTQRFFTEIRRSSKASRSILPVFFGQADACVVPESALQVMNELNPQIERRLYTLKRSENLVALLLCATAWAAQDILDLVVTGSDQAMTDPKARQALTMVQLNRFFLFEPGYMTATERLYKRFRISRGRGGYD